MPAVDWSEVFAFTVSPLEPFIRGTLTCFFLFLLFRFVVRRDIGTLGPSDLLVLVIIADAVHRRGWRQAGRLAAPRTDQR